MRLPPGSRHARRGCRRRPAGRGMTPCSLPRRCRCARRFCAVAAALVAAGPASLPAMGKQQPSWWSGMQRIDGIKRLSGSCIPHEMVHQRSQAWPLVTAATATGSLTELDCVKGRWRTIAASCAARTAAAVLQTPWSCREGLVTSSTRAASASSAHASAAHPAAAVRWRRLQMTTSFTAEAGLQCHQPLAVTAQGCVRCIKCMHLPLQCMTPTAVHTVGVTSVWLCGPRAVACYHSFGHAESTSSPMPIAEFIGSFVRLRVPLMLSC